MALSGVFSKVAFASKVPILLKATSNDSNPTPGYIYEEIANITNESLEQCDNLVSFLVERVKKPSVHTKLKALLVVKAVLQKGNPEFQHSLRHNADAIREAKSFSGPPDPMCGDHYYVEIRKAASMVLELLFDVQRSSTPSDSLPSAAGHMSGQRKMEGYGNTINPTPSTIGSTMNKFADSLRSLGKWGNDSSEGGKYQTISDKQRAVNSPPSHSITSVFQGSRSSREGDCMPAPIQMSLSNGAYPSGGIGTQVDDSYHRQDWKRIGMGVADERIGGNRPYEEVKEIELQPRTSSIQESKIVDEYTSPGGVRVSFRTDELNQFLKRCYVLDLTKIISCLRSKLENNNYQVQLRALMLIECLLDSNHGNCNDLILDQCFQKIAEMKESGNNAIKLKADKLLMTLNPRVTVPIEEPDTTSPNLFTGPDKLSDLFSPTYGSSRSQDTKNEEMRDLLPGLSSTANSDNVSGLFTGLMLSNSDKRLGISRQPQGERSATTNKHVDQTSLQGFAESADNSFDPFCLSEQSHSLTTSQPTTQIPTSDVSDLLDLDPFAGPMISNRATVSPLVEMAIAKTRSSDNRESTFSYVSSSNILNQQSSSSHDQSGRQLLYDVPRASSQSSIGHVQDVSLIDLNPAEVKNMRPQQFGRPQGESGVHMGATSGIHAILGHQGVRMPLPQHTVVNRGPSQPKETTNFGFISKKGDAFDFVKDVIKDSKKK